MAKQREKEHKKERQTLNHLNEEGLQTYLRLTDPNNQLGRQLAFGNEQEISKLRENQTKQSLVRKYETAQDSNDFFNSLTEEELVLYLQSGGQDGKFNVLETGRDQHLS